MSEVFQISDLLNSLIELEKTGHSFYDQAAKITSDAKAADLFRYLAGEEEKHEKLYMDLAEKFRDEAPGGEPLDEEYNAYLQTLLSRQFHFNDADLQSLEAAFRFAVSLEKDTLLYVGEVRTILEDRHTELFKIIQKEERKHLKLLTDFQENQSA